MVSPSHGRLPLSNGATCRQPGRQAGRRRRSQAISTIQSSRIPVILLIKPLCIGLHPPPIFPSRFKRDTVCRGTGMHDRMHRAHSVVIQTANNKEIASAKDREREGAKERAVLEGRTGFRDHISVQLNALHITKNQSSQVSFDGAFISIEVPVCACCMDPPDISTKRVPVARN